MSSLEDLPLSYILELCLMCGFVVILLQQLVTSTFSDAASCTVQLDTDTYF